MIYGVDLYEDATGLRIIPALEPLNNAVNTILGGSGSDVIFGGFSAEYIDGGADNDFIIGGTSYLQTADTLRGGAGDDTITADVAAYGTRIYGDIGNDYINIGGTDLADIYGGSGHDIIYVRSPGLGRVEGGNGNDVLVLGNQNSSYSDYDSTTVRGGSGDDTIVVWHGEWAQLEGGRGDDTFKFHDTTNIGQIVDNRSIDPPSVITILDFEDGDKIDFTNARDKDGGVMDASDLNAVNTNFGQIVLWNNRGDDGTYYSRIEMANSRLNIRSDDYLTLDDFIFA